MRYLVSALVAPASLALCLAVSTPASAAAVTLARAPRSVRLQYLSGVSCPTTSRCLAGGVDHSGAVILATSDGGSHWTAIAALRSVQFVVALDCASVSDCLVATLPRSGDRPLVYSTTDGGHHWTGFGVPKQVNVVSSFSCTGPSDCRAVGTNVNSVIVLSTSNLGRSWKATRTKLPTAMSNAPGISCASASHCVVVADGSLTTTNGGRTWVRHPLTRGAYNLDNVSCRSISHCVAAGNVTSAVPNFESADLLTSANGGTGWAIRVRKVARVTTLNDLSCSTARSCVAVGNGYTLSGPTANPTFHFFGVVERTTNGGVTWRPSSHKAASSLNEVSCVPRTLVCVAVGQTKSGSIIMRTTNAGASWATETLP